MLGAMAAIDPIEYLVKTMVVYVYKRKDTFCSEPDEIGRLFSVSVPLMKHADLVSEDTNTSVDISIEFTIFEDDHILIELIKDRDDDADLISSITCPSLNYIDFENVVSNISTQLRMQTFQRFPITGADKDSEILLHFQDFNDIDGEWDERLGFTSEDSVDFWNEDYKLFWQNRTEPIVESFICQARDLAGKWMQNTAA